MMYFLLIIGFLLLIKGVDIFVDGSSSIAGILKIPPVIIGLTIAAKTGGKINRIEGMICVGAYLIYTAYIIIR